MADLPDQHAQEGSAKTAGINWRAAVGFLVLILAVPAVLLLAAGRWDWWPAWVYFGLAVVCTVISRVIVMRRYPDLLVERSRYRESEGAKGWDRVLVPIVASYGPLTVLLVAGLDERFGWPPRLPLALQFAALLLLALGYAFSTWAMVVNRFFSAVVRIQKERDHTVVTGGPYRFVRHPGYAGGLVADLAVPLLLGSLWALVPAGLTMVGLVVRTALEDRTLREELPGYHDYARRTRYRLVPGIW